MQHKTRKIRITWIIWEEIIKWHKVEYRGTGRRKSSVARLRLVPGTGKVVINNREMREYLPLESLVLDLLQPLEVTSTR